MHHHQSPQVSHHWGMTTRSLQSPRTSDMLVLIDKAEQMDGCLAASSLR